jgi:hypothetical protein
MANNSNKVTHSQKPPRANMIKDILETNTNKTKKRTLK